MTSETGNKLLALGVPEESVDAYVALFSRLRSYRDFAHQFAQTPMGKVRFGAGYEQVVGPMFKRFYEHDTQVRSEVSARLCSFAIPQEAVDFYFLNPHTILFNLDYGDKIAQDDSDRFIESAQELMLQMLRKHLRVMYRNTNRKVLEEITRLNSLSAGNVVGTNDDRTTTVTSLGKFYSDIFQKELHIGLKKYTGWDADDLSLRVAAELGFIDLAEEKVPHLVSEFPLFHGLLLDNKGMPIGVITQDYSQGGTVEVNEVRSNTKIYPYELQKLRNEPESLEHLATTCFIVDGKKRIGDFGAFTRGNPSEIEKLAERYFQKMEPYSVNVALTRL